MERASEGGSFTLDVQSTTGGSFTLNLDRAVTVDQLKKLVSRRLKLSKDRICLLHRERQLREGTLEENGLADGARVILLPSVETGLLSQRTENSVMQALESLNDTQVNDFLSGKSPLNLTMRLGDHTMLIQLQLSTLNPSSHCTRRAADTAAGSAVRARRDTADQATSTTPKKSTSSSDASSSPAKTAKTKEGDDKHRSKDLSIQNAFDLVRSLAEIKELDELGRLMDAEADSSDEETPASRPRADSSPIRSLSKLVSSPGERSQPDEAATKYVPLPSSVKNNLIKTLSATEEGYGEAGAAAEPTITDPIAANLTSCLCSSLNPGFPCESECRPDTTPAAEILTADDAEISEEQGSFLTESTLDEYPMENFFNNAVDQGLFEDAEEMSVDREISNLARSVPAASVAAAAGAGAAPARSGDSSVAEPLPSFQNLNDTNKNKRLHYLLHKTSKYKHPISQNKQKAFMQSVVNKHIKRSLSRQDGAQPSTSRVERAPSPRKLALLHLPEDDADDSSQPSTSRHSNNPFKVPDVPKAKSQPTSLSFPDTKALIEASKNLTQTLKKLSKEVLINKADDGEAEEIIRTKTGAVIESMKHHGKGIYSGTFSGTLNPALQDRFGRPKRDISTIIHILNDLLCATPPFNSTAKDGRQRALLPSNICTSCSSSCAYGQCDGHYPASTSAASTSAASTSAGAAPCACRDAHKCACKARTECGCADDPACKKCDTAKALAIENSKTKCKVEQLRLVMQQKKQRREARKLQAGPYIKPPPPTKQAPRPDQLLA